MTSRAAQTSSNQPALSPPRRKDQILQKQRSPDNS